MSDPPLTRYAQLVPNWFVSRTGEWVKWSEVEPLLLRFAKILSEIRAQLGSKGEALTFDELPKALAENLTWLDAETMKREVFELEAVNEKLSDLLKRTAIALKGPEPEGVVWDWSDLPTRCAQLRQERGGEHDPAEGSPA